MKKPTRIEREFGVPVPGEILEPEQWTRTALKKLPVHGPLDLVSLFGRKAPLIVDLGCGNGRFLIGSALERPEFDHIGIDILPMVLRYATRRGNQRGLGNLRFAAIDAQRFVGEFLTTQSVREVHCYHPQPFHDARDMEKRLLTPTFLVQVFRILETGGQFFVQTDNTPYWEYLTRIASVFFAFREQSGPWPDALAGRTRREIIGIARGYAIHRGVGVKRADLSEGRVAELAGTLPAPKFDAGPRLKDLDRLESEGGAAPGPRPRRRGRSSRPCPRRRK
ncbi:MAG: methyltransferase domain-containing protein [Planctomycetes bacterium]|nr:methyltransferase domain-containing protein [Planctomycetota bacterium]